MIATWQFFSFTEHVLPFHPPVARSNASLHGLLGHIIVDDRTGLLRMICKAGSESTILYSFPA